MTRATGSSSSVPSSKRRSNARPGVARVKPQNSGKITAARLKDNGRAMNSRDGSVSGGGNTTNKPRCSWASTPKTVSGHNRHIHSHKVFKPVACRGKTSLGWFYGFTLHLVANDRGERLAFRITPSNVDDRQPRPELTPGLTGKLFADRGYLSQLLFRTLWDQGLQLITKVRRNMHHKLLPLFDKLVLRKRAIIETINDPLKTIQQVEHTRHRSVVNAMVNILAALTAYTHQPRKPSLNLSQYEFKLINCHA